MKKFREYLMSGKLAAMVCESVQGESVKNASMVYNVLKPLVSQTKDVEQIWLMCLDAKNCIKTIEKITAGTLSNCVVYRREIVKTLIKCEASACILVHNHPSGDPDPSGDDNVTTRLVAMSCAAIDVTLHDHVVIGSQGRFFSYADSGLIEKYCKEEGV